MEIIRLKPCDDLDGVSDEMTEETLNSGKEKMKLRTERLLIMNNLRRKELINLMKEE